MLVTDSIAAGAAPARSAVPRPIAWLLLVASAAGVLAVGLVTTVVILSGLQPRATPIPAAFWAAVAFGALVTCASLGTRTVRWIFLLRRTHTRIPLRDACIRYLMPELVPRAVMRLFRPIERLLEASPFRVYSAHYMAIVEKPDDGGAQS
jgi:hypothetical protein